MKCGNRYINAAEQANIPKFSKLDDIGTLFSTFEFKNLRGLLNYSLMVH